MELNSLRCFVAVAEELHFGRAAERLHLTPSPVSRTVKDLEHEFTTPLFVRRYHAVELTPAGQALLDPAREILRGVNDLRSIIESVTESGPAAVRVGGTHIAPPAVLDAVVATISRFMPQARVDVTLAPSAEQLESLAAGERHLVVVHLPVEQPGISAIALVSYDFWVAMRPDDPLAAHETVSLSDLGSRRVALTSPKVHPLAMTGLRDQLEAAGVSDVHFMPSADPFLMAQHIRHTRDLALATNPSLGGPSRVFDDPEFTLLPLEGEIQLQLGIAFRERDLISMPGLGEAVKALQAAFDVSGATSGMR